MFDKFIVKGGENVHKVDRTLANRVVERKNMINSTYGGEFALRVLGKVYLGGFEFEFGFELFSAFSLVYCFSCHLLVLWVFLLLNDLFELFIGFWSSSYASYVLNSKFKFYAIVLLMYSSRERLRNQVVSTLIWL
jgi:hypothetical protein